MSAQANAPCIIKKVKKVQGGGHHGGAWKVAIFSFLQSHGAVRAGFEVRPLRDGFRVILTSADRRLPNPRHPLRMREHREAEVPKEQ